MRLLLETTYEAIVDAGFDPETLRGRNFGVFIGTFYVESEEAFTVDTDEIDGYGVLGSARALLSNRISYSFDFKGPSITVDTACSSTMVALNHALLALRSGQCDAAIVGGSLLCLKPATTLSISRLGMLSRDGKCKSFDAGADGYARSETVGVFLVQRRSEARRIYAKLLHVKTNVDGYKREGITVPSSEMQEKLLREVYTEAKVDPLKVGYVEAHGTGTALGDPPEIAAFRRVFCGTGRQTALKIGAVKSNVGHSEAASGVCCMAKVILAMETGLIAANLHFKKANPSIPSLLDGSVKVVNEATPFPGGPVGIHSTGFGGANAHVILEANPGPHVDEVPRKRTGLPRLVLLAGRSKESLQHTIERLVAEGPHPDSAYTLLNLVGQPSTQQFPFRSHVLMPVDGAGKEAVKAVAEQAPLEKRPVWFVFSCMGCQWSGMARQMMPFDVFARSLHQSHDLLTQFGIDLIDAVTKDRVEKMSLASTLASITAVQVALVDVLLAVGVKPDGMLGHSLGEIACAYADQCFTAEQALLCSYWRGRCAELGDLPKGAMAAVGLTWEEAQKRCRDGVVAAAHNAEDSVTVSGPAAAVATLVQELKAENVFAREVDSGDVAFHSEHMKNLAHMLLEHLKEVVPAPKARSHRWVSTSLPENRWEEPLARMSSAEYHVNNLLSTVLFSEALHHVPKDAVVIEVGPHCILLPLLRRGLGSDASCLGLMKRHADNVLLFLGALGKLHSLGVKLDLSPLYPPVVLPVPRGTPSIAHLVSWDHAHAWTVARWDDFSTLAHAPEKVIEVNIEAHQNEAYLADHKIDGRVLFPAAGHIMLVWKFLATRFGKPFEELPVVLEDIIIHRAIIIDKGKTVRIHVSILRVTGEFEISEGSTVVSTGRIRHAEGDEERLDIHFSNLHNDEATYELDAEDIYKELRLRGYEYGSSFQGIMSVDMEKQCGKLKWEENWLTFMDTLVQFSILHTPQRCLKLPVGLSRCRIEPLLHRQMVEESQDAGLAVVYEKGPINCRAGGIVMEGIKLSVAPRRILQQPTVLNEYKFVPYIDGETAKTEREADIRKYVEVCNAVARHAVVLSCKQEEDIPKELMESSNALEQVSLGYFDTAVEKHGLLKVLTTIKHRANTSSLTSTIQSVLSVCENDLQKDLLNTALFGEDPFRHILDVVVENTSLKKLRVVEMATAGSSYLLAPIVCSLLPLSNPLLNIEYSVAHRSPDRIAPGQVPKGATVITWNLTSGSKTELPEADLFVVWLSATDEECLEPFLKQLDIPCKNQAFVLMAIRTRPTPAEMFLSAVGGLQLSVHNAEELKSRLQSSGLRLVSHKSNNLAALLLFRKTDYAAVAKPEMVRVNNSNCEWAETLKEKVAAYGNKPSGAKIWLVAEECTSGVVGLTNCLRRETAECRFRCIFNASLMQTEQTIDLSPSNQDLNCILAQDLVMNIYRDGQWGSFRFSGTLTSDAQKKVTDFAFFDVGTHGDLSSLRWYESPLRYAAIDHGTNLCSVYYTTVSSADVTRATTNIPSDSGRGQYIARTGATYKLWPPRLGIIEPPQGRILALRVMDCGYQDARVSTVKTNSRVTCVATLNHSPCYRSCIQEFSGRDRLGRRVMGLVTSGSMATVVAATVGLLWEVPDTWNLSEATTVPLAYVTAYYALLVRGSMRPGESVLVHLGSSAAGQAAISLALSMGCTVFTTVESQNERQFQVRRFPQLEEGNIANIRDLSFERIVDIKTKGKGARRAALRLACARRLLTPEGVDLVLTALTQHNIQGSVRCLAARGRFLEVRTTDLSEDSQLRMSLARPIKLEDLLEDSLLASEERRRVFALVQEGIASGAVRPLDSVKFSLCNAGEAFQLAASGNQSGKVVLEIRPEESVRTVAPVKPLSVEAVPRTYFYEHKCYIIIGGLGGFGLEFVDWMVTRGCRRLILTSRSGVQTGYQKLCLRRWCQAGVDIVTTMLNASTHDGAQGIISKAAAIGPVGGIFNLGAALHDGLLENQSVEAFETVLDIKINGTKHLDNISRHLCPALDHFVCFSSMSSALGNIGQTNYGYANSAMERICECRAADGLSALAILWGPVGDVGMFRKIAGDDAVVSGLKPQRISSYLAVMDQLFCQPHTVVCSFVNAELTSKEDVNIKSGFVHSIARIFGATDPSSLNPSASLRELGMDSLMAVEVKQTIEHECGFSPSMQEMGRLTLNDLTKMTESNDGSA